MLQDGGAWSGVRAGRCSARRGAARAPARPGAAAERLGLGDCGRTPYRRLSGGQQQRLGLAMALVGRPEVVFVDEPTAGMDPRRGARPGSCSRGCARDGVTVVLTTHYMDEAERLADRIHIIDRGRLVAGGTPLELTRGGMSSHDPAGRDRSVPARCSRVAEAALRRRRGSAARQQSLVVTGPRTRRAGGLTLVRRAGRAGRVPAARAAATWRTSSSSSPGGSCGRDRPADLHPAPGAAPLPRMVLAQARIEARLMLRNGEQLLLALVIPVLVLVGWCRRGRLGLTTPTRVDCSAGGPRPGGDVDGVHLAGHRHRLRAPLRRAQAARRPPLPRSGLLAGKAGRLCSSRRCSSSSSAVGLALGWRPARRAALAGAVLLVLLGTAAFAALGLLLAGTLRAEATLAAANLVYLLLLGGGAAAARLGVRRDLRRGPAVAAHRRARARGCGRRSRTAPSPVQPALVLLAWVVGRDRGRGADVPVGVSGTCGAPGWRWRRAGRQRRDRRDRRRGPADRVRPGLPDRPHCTEDSFVPTASWASTGRSSSGTGR